MVRLSRDLHDLCQAGHVKIVACLLVYIEGTIISNPSSLCNGKGYFSLVHGFIGGIQGDLFWEQLDVILPMIREAIDMPDKKMLNQITLIRLMML
jgi:hypothetical protein